MFIINIQEDMTIIEVTDFLAAIFNFHKIGAFKTYINASFGFGIHRSIQNNTLFVYLSEIFRDI